MRCEHGRSVSDIKILLKEKGREIWAGGGMSEGASERRGQGLQGVRRIHLSPRDSLAFGRGRLVINRPGSGCLTGGSLGLDGQKLISRANSQRMDGDTNRRMSQK